MRLRAAAVPALLVLALGGCTSSTQGVSVDTSSPAPCQEGLDASVTSGGQPDSFDEGKSAALTSLPDGLQFADLKVGDGGLVGSGQCVTVHYTGWLSDGAKFDSSRDAGKGLRFQVGTGGVIKGWDQGVPGMKVGGRRRLVIPPALGYGAQGSAPKIPANASLVFIVELLKINP
jgi:FKBP-type peptidyl-prolyl cis-trans isomerase